MTMMEPDNGVADSGIIATREIGEELELGEDTDSHGWEM
jgi:hypothetical protein